MHGPGPMHPARSPRHDHSSLDRYLDDMGTHDRLDADDEQALARHVVERRRAYWRSLLGSPARLPGILDAIEKQLKEPEPSAAALALRAALRRRDPAASEDVAAQELAAPCEALALALTSAGIDPALVDPTTNGSASSTGPETARAYAKRVRSARDAYQVARNRFVCANLRLVVMLAGRYGVHHMSLADRVQEGNLGLLKAVDRFDPERGVRFSTYAAWWIRHAITRALTNNGRVVRVPAHVQALFTKMRHARSRLRSTYQREPTDEELATELGVTPGKLRSVRDAMQMRAVELDAPSTPGSEISLSEAVTAENAVEFGATLDARRNRTLAVLAFGSLEDREREILRQRFGLSGADTQTLQALGAQYGVSRERVRQLQQRALAKLRHAVESNPAPSCAFASA